jgi:hypothetical protein
MEIGNTITIIVGIGVILIGVGAFFNPNFARWVNAPGSPRLKAMIAMVAGAGIVVAGLVFQFPE